MYQYRMYQFLGCLFRGKIDFRVSFLVKSQINISFRCHFRKRLFRVLILIKFQRSNFLVKILECCHDCSVFIINGP